MSILKKSGGDLDPKVEADVIMTSAILGFCVTRVKLGQPFSFDIEHPTQDVINDAKKYQGFLEEWQQFLGVLSDVSEVLDFNGVDSRYLKDAQSPEWQVGARITGREGGGGLAPQERHKAMESAQALSASRLEAQNPVGYSGRGAYTGMIDDPVNHSTFRQPTKRIIITDQERWHSGKDYQGLIRGGGEGSAREFVNLSNDPKAGMGDFTTRQYQKLLADDQGKTGGLVGYVHGMSWAIQECIKCGPWCTPYEQAVGSDTTKMASCFPCTTYMYAAGFPPSSAHLGRGESWAPLPVNQSSPYNSIASSLNIRWHAQCHHYLLQGSACLAKFAQSHRSKADGVRMGFRNGKYRVQSVDVSRPYVGSAHRSALEALRTYLKFSNISKGGNLILDALTVHESEWKRLYNTLHDVTPESAAHAAAQTGEWQVVQGRRRGHK